MVNVWVMVNALNALSVILYNSYLLSSPSLSTATFTYIYAPLFSIRCEKKNQIIYSVSVHCVCLIQYCIEQTTERKHMHYACSTFVFFVHFIFQWIYLNSSQFGIFKFLALFFSFFTFFQFGFSFHFSSI